MHRFCVSLLRKGDQKQVLNLRLSLRTSRKSGHEASLLTRRIADGIYGIRGASPPLAPHQSRWLIAAARSKDQPEV
jgi:hypothetical protein